MTKSGLSEVLKIVVGYRLVSKRPRAGKIKNHFYRGAKKT
jgi:hypothetical protein